MKVKTTTAVLALIFLASFSLAWWDSSWNYRVPVTITETSGSTLTDYQVLITVDTASLISAGKLQSDCSDIRFVDNDDSTELSYWIEDGTCDSSETHIWVKVPSIPASSSKTIYMYYGNPEATSASDGDSVFELFDDFEEGSIDTSKWVIKKTTGTVNIVSGALHVKAANSWEHAGVYTANIFDEDNKVTEVDIKTVGGSKQQNEILYQIPGTETDYIAIFRANGPINEYTRQSGTWTLVYSSTTTLASNTWYHMKIITTGTQVKLYIYDESGNLLENSGWIDYDSFSGNHFFLGMAYNGDEGYFDNVRVRKYASSEPTTSLGAEEIAQETWWNSDWQYKRHVTISGTSLTDFQVRIDLDTATLIAEGKMNEDCSDLRVIDSDDQTELPFWIADGSCNTANTHIWVKTNVPKTIYLYYGNPDATPVSYTCDQIFEFCDDFSGDLSKWHSDGTINVLEDADGQLHTQGDNDGNTETWWLYADDGNGGILQLTNPTVIGLKVKDVGSGTNYIYVGTTEESNTANAPFDSGTVDQGRVEMHSGTTQWELFQNDGAGPSSSSATSSSSIDISSYHIVELKESSATSSELVVDDAQEASISSGVDYSSANGLALEWIDSSDAGMINTYIDYIYVRKYTSDEPTVMVGSEELGNPTVSITSINPAYPKEGDTVTLQFSFTKSLPDNYTIDWGDGNELLYTPSDPDAMNDTRYHTYNTYGDYTINVTAYWPEYADSDTYDLHVYTKITSVSYTITSNGPYYTGDDISITISWTGGSGDVEIDYKLTGCDDEKVINTVGNPDTTNSYDDVQSWEYSNIGCNETSCYLTSPGYITVVDKKTGDSKTIETNTPIYAFNVSYAGPIQGAPIVIGDNVDFVGYVDFARETPFTSDIVWNMGETSENILFNSSASEKELVTDYESSPSPPFCTKIWRYTATGEHAFTSSGTFSVSLSATLDGRTKDYSNSIDIEQIQVSTCNSGDEGDAIVFLLKDEQTNEDINGSTSLSLSLTHKYGGQDEVSMNVTNTSSFHLCITPESTYNISGIVQYLADNYRTREYYFLNATVQSTGDPTEISLYDIAIPSSDLETVTVKEGITALPNVYVILQRYYIEENAYKTVQVAKTNENGEVGLYVEPYDAFYRMIIHDGSSVLATTAPAKFLTSTETVNILETVESLLDKIDKIHYTCEFNASTSIARCTVSDPTGVSHILSFKSGVTNLWGTTVVCSQNTSDTASITFVCDLTNASGSPFIDLNVETSDGAKITLFHHIYSNEGFIPIERVFLAFFIVLGLALIGLFHPEAAVVFALIGLAFSYVMGLMWLQWSTLIALVIVAGAYIVLRRR